MRVQRYVLFLVWQVFENKKVRNTKNSITFALQLRKDRNVAQLVAHYVRDVGVGRSSRLIPTKGDNRVDSVAAFSLSAL